MSSLEPSDSSERNLRDLNPHIDNRISLKTLQDEMAGDLFHLVDSNRAYLRKWLPWLDANTTMEESAVFIRNSIESMENRKQIVWGIFIENQLSGVISFNSISWLTGTARIGYWLAESATGRGVITRCVTAVEQVAFRDLNLEKTEISCAVENVRSRGIPERLGYRLEGTIRRSEFLYGRIVDHLVFGKLVSEYTGEER